jgi:hypothetical protein
MFLLEECDYQINLIHHTKMGRSDKIDIILPHRDFFLLLLFLHLLTCVYIVCTTSPLGPCFQAEPVPLSSLILLFVQCNVGNTV